MPLRERPWADASMGQNLRGQETLHAHHLATFAAPAQEFLFSQTSTWITGRIDPCITPDISSMNSTLAMTGSSQHLQHRGDLCLQRTGIDRGGAFIDVMLQP